MSQNKTAHITALAVVGLVLLSTIAVSGVGATATSTSDLDPAKNATQLNSTSNSSDINWRKPLRLQDGYEKEFQDSKEPQPNDATAEPTPQASKQVSDSDDAYKTEEGHYLHLDSDISGTWSNGWKVKYVADGSDVLSWPSDAELEYVSISSTATANGIAPKLSPSSGFLSVSSNVGEFDRKWSDPGSLSQPRVAHEYVDLTASSSWSLTGVAIDTTGELGFSWRSVTLNTDMNAAP